MGEEAGVSVGNDATRESMKADDIVNEKFCECGSVGSCLRGDEMCHFGESINDYKDSVEIVGIR